MKQYKMQITDKALDSLSESPLHLLLWQIYRHMHTNLINVRVTYAS